MNSGSLHWVQLVGYAASVLVFSTFYMKTMIPLRCVAITSNVAFLTYGYFAGLYPVFLLHTVLLPLNVFRLHQMYQAQGAAPSIARAGPLPRVDAPLRQAGILQGEGTAFQKGDAADKLYYLEQGTVWLPEVDRTIHAGRDHR